MSILVSSIHTAGVTIGIGGLVYTATVSITAVVGVFAGTETRRRDARETLKILLGKTSISGGPIGSTTVNRDVSRRGRGR
jgi:hypothetical protein